MQVVRITKPNRKDDTLVRFFAQQTKKQSTN